MYFQVSMSPLPPRRTASCAVIRSFVTGILFLHMYSLSAQSLITTVAGTAGVAGFLGDGGPAISATFNIPLGICFYSAGNFYIAYFKKQRGRESDGGTGGGSTNA